MPVLSRPDGITLYTNSDHGVLAVYRPSYYPVDGPDGWARMLAQFKANGV